MDDDVGGGFGCVCVEDFGGDVADDTGRRLELVDAPFFEGGRHVVDFVVGVPESGLQGPAAIVPDIGIAIFAISVGSDTVGGGSEAFVLLTGGEVLEKVGPNPKETTVALNSCPEGRGPPEGAAMGSRNG